MPLAAAEHASPPFDLDRLRRTPLVREPFPHVIVPRFLNPADLPGINRDFPAIRHPGSFPSASLACGPAFQGLLDALEAPPLMIAMSEKFEIDLARRPTIVTVRGRAQAKDGRIHTDSPTKLITVLIYLNSRWETPSGRLRLLRSGDTLDNAVAEVPPDEGTLLAFRVTENSWHGHAPFEGERRVLQLNWVTDDRVVQREQARHGVTARLKRWLRLS